MTNRALRIGCQWTLVLAFTGLLSAQAPRDRTSVADRPAYFPVAAQTSEVGLQELVRAASIAGAPLSASPASETLDFSYQWLRLSRLYRYQDWDASNPALARAWLAIQQRTRQCLLILTAIAEIDRTKPSGMEVFEKMLRDNRTDAQKRDTTLTFIDWAIAQGRKGDLEKQFRQSEADLFRAIGALRQVGDNLSRYSTASGIDAAYFPSWLGVFANDELVLHNVSGQDWENAAVAVTVHQRDGNDIVHLHYIDRWRSGEAMQAYYPYRGTDYAVPEAAADPVAVDVALYLPSQTVTARYLLPPQEWDRLVHSYCSRLRFTGTFLGPYVESQTNRRLPPGFQFSFSGLPRLPVKEVVIQFFAGDTEDANTAQGVIFQVNDVLKPDTLYPYRTELFDSGVLSRMDAPKHVHLILKLSGTTDEEEIRFF
jgi:hypothetical protein